MKILSITKINSFESLSKRFKNQEKIDIIIIETKSCFNEYCNLLGYPLYNKKVYYYYTYKGIPLILPWQHRI